MRFFSDLSDRLLTYPPHDRYTIAALISTHRQALWRICSNAFPRRIKRKTSNEQIQTLFCLYLKKISPSEYNAARKALIAHYEQQLHERVGVETYVSEDWLPLVLELIAQSLLLQMPDEEYHCKAIEYTIKVYAITNRPQHKAAIVNVLNNLSQEKPDNPIDQSSRVIAQKLLICIQADLQSKEFIEANSYLLERAR